MTSRDHARLAIVAKGRYGFSCFRVEREQKRSSRRVDDAVGVADAAAAEDVAFASPAADQVGDVERPEQMAVSGIHGVDAAARIRYIHHSVDNHRRRLVANAVDDAVLE